VKEICIMWLKSHTSGTPVLNVVKRGPDEFFRREKFPGLFLSFLFKKSTFLTSNFQGLCQRKELTGYWCPVAQRNYTCDPSKLKGTRQIWYYLNKGLLNTSIIACASEFFPVVLVAHWLVCGGKFFGEGNFGLFEILLIRIIFKVEVQSVRK
jgi:hypothetical protein